MDFVLKMMNLIQMARLARRFSGPIAARGICGALLLLPRILVEMAAFSIENSTKNAAISNRNLQ